MYLQANNPIKIFCKNRIYGDGWLLFEAFDAKGVPKGEALLEKTVKITCVTHGESDQEVVG